MARLETTAGCRVERPSQGERPAAQGPGGSKARASPPRRRTSWSLPRQKETVRSLRTELRRLDKEVVRRLSPGTRLDQEKERTERMSKRCSPGGEDTGPCARSHPTRFSGVRVKARLAICATLRRGATRCWRPGKRRFSRLRRQEGGVRFTMRCRRRSGSCAWCCSGSRSILAPGLTRVERPGP